jgi:beta-N-acetylhexosaminidase
MFRFGTIAVTLFLSFWSFAGIENKKTISVGQLLFIGIDGTEWSTETSQLLQQIQPGGIILFKRNILAPSQTLNFNQQLINFFIENKLPPPLLAIDQEGGGVYRVPTDPLLPSAAAMGRSQNPKLIRDYGRVIGRILKAFKFSMNLAPVLDLRLKETDFIGNRSFGANPVLVSSNGVLFAKGLLESGILPTGKHFPGVGGLNLDPHRETPQADLDWVQSWNKELYPFREFSRLFPTALLLSHVVYPKMDKKRVPASFSEHIIDEGLRGKLQFRGLVITDDLMMEGAKKQADPVKSAIESLKAGADMVMVTWSTRMQQKLIAAIEGAINSGELDSNSIQEKIKRIVSIKNLLYGEHSSNVKLQATDGALSFKSTDLESLNKELLLEILNQDNQRNLGFVKSIAETPLFVVDAPGRLQKEVLQNRDLKKTDFFNMKNSESWLTLRRRMQKNPEAMLLFFVRSKSSLDNLNWFTVAEKKKLVIVNLFAVEIKSPERFAANYSPFWTFNNLYSGIAQAWDKKLLRKVSANNRK